MCEICELLIYFAQRIKFFIATQLTKRFNNQNVLSKFQSKFWKNYDKTVLVGLLMILLREAKEWLLIKIKS